MPLLILFWDAKNRACIHSGCIWEYLRMLRVFCCSSGCILIAYNKAAESGIRGLLKHRLWWLGFCRKAVLVAVISTIHLSEICILDGAMNENAKWH